MSKLILLITFVFLLSCTSSKKYSPEYSKHKVYQGTYETDGVVIAERSSVELIDRMVIYDISYSMESEEPDSVIESIKTLTNSYKGYIINSGKNNIRIRIPSNNSSGIIKDIEYLAEVIDKNISGKDVTEEYSDLEIKIDNIEKARKRYLELLAKAENVSAALKVEKELERLQRELDLLKGREKRMGHLVEYVTIDVNVKKGIKPGPLGYIVVGFYKAIKWLFVW